MYPSLYKKLAQKNAYSSTKGSFSIPNDNENLNDFKRSHNRHEPAIVAEFPVSQSHQFPLSNLSETE